MKSYNSGTGGLRKIAYSHGHVAPPKEWPIKVLKASYC